MIFFIFIFLCFLFGSQIGALIVIKALDKKNIINEGSGNPGTTNAMRLYGLGVGLIVFFFDFNKSFLPLLAGKYYGLSQDVLATGLTAAVIGHSFSPFWGFAGGKGVATFFGGLAAYDQHLFLMAATLWGTTYMITSLSALSALSMITFLMGYLTCQDHYTLLPVLFLIFIRHRSNWKAWHTQKLTTKAS